MVLKILSLALSKSIKLDDIFYYCYKLDSQLPTSLRGIGVVEYTVIAKNGRRF
jgi:hypothetical protein